MASRPTKWDSKTDVLVFGTGGAALTVAILACSVAHTTRGPGKPSTPAVHALAPE
jgi:hypothetical protein